MKLPARIRDLLHPIRGSLFLSALLIFIDVVLSCSYMFSLFVCPIWFFVALIRARPFDTGVAAARVLAPVVTGLLIFANSEWQNDIAQARAERIVEACQRYHEANGTYPAKLVDLVPQYLSAIPSAKYCGAWAEFFYHKSPDDERAILWWVELPPFGCRTYNFAASRWGYLD